MKYTFITDDGQEKTVRVPEEVLAQGKKEGLTHKETLMRFLSDEGYIVDPVVAELTAKAKANGTGLQARTGKRKPPTRKPDDIKRALIAGLAEYLNGLGNSDADLVNMIHSIEVTNIERIIAFQIGDDKYELTLSKKRKPKA